MINEQILLTDLPEEVYYSFQDYLTQDDYQQLLNTSKQDFFQIRRKSIIYHLTEKYSIKYCEDENYRNQLIEKVENPFKQIRIKLLASVMKHYEYLFDLVPIHLILKSQFQENPYISRHVKELILDSYFLDTPLVNVSQCEKVTFKDCHITDISLLKDCEHITLHSCRNVTDFSSLGKQRTLLIELTHHLTNVMNLHSIRTLILKHCSDLVDISPLRGVYDLSLIHCSQVTDISSLGGHHRLEIRFIMLQKLSGYHALKDIPVVNLCKCNISDASVLSNAKVVYLHLCHDLVDVSPLKGVKDLTLRDCSNVRDISPLRAVKKLTLIHLTNLKKYEGINQMIDLSLEVNNSSYSMVKLFPNAKSIKFSYIEFRYPQIIQRLQSFTNLHSLTFCGCTPMKIEVNIDIHTVIIEHCLLESISGLGKSHVVRLINCHGEVDVSSLVTVAFVSIIQCQFKNVNYESLKNVSRLKVTDFRRIPFQENL